MSFFNSKPWAKIPTDLLENKAMNRAEKMLEPELRCAPVLLYLAGATKADEDGIFDIGDGEEFASLIKVDSPENVRQVAEAMVKLRIFAHVPKSSIFLFVEWEYPTRQPNKTLRNRFNAACEIWKNTQAESAFFNPQSTNVDTVRNDIKALENRCFNTIHDAVNECCDTIQGCSDAISQNRREREDKRETEQIISDVEKNTHTRVEGVGGEELPAACEPLEGSTAASSENSVDVEKNNTETSEKLIDVPNWSIVPESDVPASENVPDIDKETEDASFMPEEIKKIKGEAFKIFQDFFKTSNLAYNETKGAKAVEGIVQELFESAQNKADVPEMAKAICKEFKKMHTEPMPNKWHGIPLYPKYMINETVWAYLLNHAELPPAQFRPLREEDIDREETDRWLQENFEVYGIDPEAPNAMMQLCLAKARNNAAEPV